MRIKKYLAENLKEGKSLVARELGEEAVILSSRTVKLPNSGEERIEIVAAIDDSPIHGQAAKSSLSPFTDDKRITEDDMKYVQETDFLSVTGQLFGELASIKDMISNVWVDIQFKYGGVLGPMLGNLYKSLRKSGLKETLAMNMAGKLSSEGILKDKNKIIAGAKNYLAAGLSVLPPIQKGQKRKSVVFVGPTGNGKSLSLIKLAVISRLVHDMNVLVVSTDTQKVGGAEQLQTYASIAALQFRSAYTPDDLKDIMINNADKDLVLIDTVGKNQNNPQYIEEIMSYIEISKPEFVYLVVSANTSETNLTQTIKAYREMNVNALIITKMDEAHSFGDLIGGLYQNPLPVAYLATGQQIPEDFEPATLDKLTKLVIPDNIDLTGA
jgi:flagellar biosynthesis protein FlhF